MLEVILAAIGVLAVALLLVGILASLPSCPPVAAKSPKSKKLKRRIVHLEKRLDAMASDIPPRVDCSGPGSQDFGFHSCE